MPFLPERPRFKGITLPPSGWALAVLLSLYIFVGLIGHDPWKHDDATSIGLAFGIAGDHFGLLPLLAGQPYPDAPLYYWIAAAFIRAFSWLLPAHDAARLATGLCTLLALQFILLAARELHGKAFSAAGPLILAGSIGFLFHAHEAQPMLAALAAHAAVYWSLALMPRRPRIAVLFFGGALAVAFLADGLLPLLTLVPVLALSLAFAANRPIHALRMTLGIGLGAALTGLWLVPLHLETPALAALFWQKELASIAAPALQPWTNGAHYLNILMWYAWPALPLAAWALWAMRRQLSAMPIALPALSFAAILALLACGVPTSSAAALPLLPPLVLLAVPGVAALRRGAANAFDWFSMITFTFLAAVCWIVWCALVFGWPVGLARQAVRLEPGFVGQFNALAFGFAVAVTLIWGWLIVTSPRSPIRGLMHWMSGLTLFWILLAVLWMPWIDYGKTYRPVSAALAQALPQRVTCIANANLADSLLALFDYFDGIRTVPLGSSESRHCNLLLLQGEPRDPEAITAAGWRLIEDAKRPSDRHENDHYRLYRRGARAKPATSLTDVADPLPPDARPR